MVVVDVPIAFREGYPEVSPANKSFGAIQRMGTFRTDDPATAIVDALAPRPGDMLS